MNNDIMILREKLVKLTQILADRGIEVTQRGTQAYVEADKRTGKPKRVNLPMLSDSASEGLIAAIEGFLDHEVGHLLFSDFSTIVKANKKGGKIATLHNVIEDTFVERKMRERFPGSDHNLSVMGEFFLREIIVPGLEEATSPEQAFGWMFVPWMRAWAGQKVFQDFMKDRWGLLGEAVGRLKGLEGRLMRINSSQEALDLAIEIAKRLAPPPPPPPPAPKEKPAEKPPVETPPTPPEPGEGKAEPDDEPKTEDQDEHEGKSSGDDEPESSKPDDADVEPDEFDEHDDGDGGPEPDEDRDEDHDKDPGVREESEPGVDDDDQSDDEGSDPKPASEGDGDKPDGDDGADEDDSTGLSAGADGDDFDEDDAGGEDLDGASESDASDDGEEIDGPGKASEDTTDFLSGDIPDFDGEITKMLSREATESMSVAEYRLFTRDFDKIEPVQVPDYFDAARTKRMDEETQGMVGVMQKDLERLMAARSKVVRYPGQRSGRVHASSLHRLAVGDSRVFYKKEEHHSKDTAVTLLVDCSGSMGGSKIKIACEAAYALSAVLERINIKHEVIGFTTWGYHGEIPGFGRKVIRLEMEKAGFEFSRWEGLWMPVFKGFDERLTPTIKSRFAFMATAAGGFGDRLNNNVDGECVEIAARRLDQQRAARKVMIVLSDGAPCAQGDLYAQTAYLIKVVKQIENSKSMEIVGIGIKDRSVERFYKNNVVLNDINQLPTQVMSELRRILL